MTNNGTFFRQDKIAAPMIQWANAAHWADRANIAYTDPPPLSLVLFPIHMLVYLGTAPLFNFALKVLPLYQFRYIIVIVILRLSCLPSIFLL